MTDDSPESPEPPPDPGRPRREGPTIDLMASEVSGDTASPNSGAEAMGTPRRPWGAFATAVLAAVAGAGAAALVLAAAVLTGYPAAAPIAAPPADTAAMDALASRLADVEAKAARPAAAAPDTVAPARIEALEKSVAALRGEFAALRAQSEKLAAAVGEVKSAPREAAAAPDLSGIEDRLAQLERATRAQNSEIAQESKKPADDAPLRRVVAATLLDVAVRQSEPYAAPLAAAKSWAENPDALKPLDGFAATGVPSPASLSRELLTLVPKLAPPAPETAGAGSGLVDRLEAGASRLVRIERTDTVGNDRNAIVARVTAAALRNDYNEARRELNTLNPADRAAAQGWIDKADARDAALAASHQFAAGAMAALAKPGQ